VSHDCLTKQNKETYLEPAKRHTVIQIFYSNQSRIEKGERRERTSVGLERRLDKPKIGDVT
jgi:hypothetical protein